ncbi:MAG: CRISPR-associated endonuclease Cas3'', partial [Bacillota bacterium]
FLNQMLLAEKEIIWIRQIAHVKQLEDGLWDEPHLLLDHLRATAEKAEDYAKKFASGEWGKAAGFAHDVGKSRIAWQEYLQCKSGYGYDKEAHLENKPGKMPHAIQGAKLTELLFDKAPGRFLSYIIAGHHAGLPDWSSAQGTGRGALQYQISAPVTLDEIDPHLIHKLGALKPARPPWKFHNSGLDLSLWIRMLYSCLVDADFLDTESYMEKEKFSSRGAFASLPELRNNLNGYIETLESTSPETEMNTIRRLVRTKCLEKASEERGVFALAVPTGGGKTLSSLSFALEHAIKHNMERIIYVIPYTSIIEQNANVFRAAVGAKQIIEHHSNLNEDDDSAKSRLASENWDAPIIVTTAVQFFETLFASKSSRCRKLHNIVNAVVVLDEAQLLPMEFLQPILETIQLLVNRYRSSFVISTATQPAFQERRVYGQTFNGLKEINNIMGNSLDELYQKLKRVKVILPDDIHTTIDFKTLAADLVKHEQVLCIVSDRKSCRELHNLMPGGTFHLSSLMCGQHRSTVIDKIKDDLSNKKTVRVISTQLVEAGVDIDFPIVYRAMCGLDSIAQAAGRCNREGKLKYGEVRIFNPPRKPPAGVLRKSTDITKNILAEKPGNILDHNLFKKYFSELYWTVNSLDQKGITDLLTPEPSECGIYFRTAAERFQIINDSQQKSVIVRYGESDYYINLLKLKGPERWLMRKLQRYTVNIYNHEFDHLLYEGAIEEVHPYIYVLSSNNFYAEDLGLLVDQDRFEPEDFII